MALKYEQIADALRAQIDGEVLRPGMAVPSERDLCEQWNVSRATAIKALDVLKADGLLVAVQGKGHQVTDTPLARMAGGRRQDTVRSGGRPFRRLGTPAYEVPPGHIAEALEIAAGAEALRRDRLMLLEDGGPLSVVRAWFPVVVARVCPRLSQEGPIAEGTTRYVARWAGRSPSEGMDVTSVRLASAGEAELLGVERPVAVAVDVHVARDGEGALVVEEGVTPSGAWERCERYPMGGATPGT